MSTSPSESTQQSQSSSERSTLPMGSHQELQPSQDIAEYLKSYARQRPEVAALWCLGIGFILGWKLKPW